MLDGNSEIGAHVQSEIGNLIFILFYLDRRNFKINFALCAQRLLGYLFIKELWYEYFLITFY